jgi:chromatin segregation and condensation protein Rec8/ScpA/Scc1 (kleisin family)
VIVRELDLDLDAFEGPDLLLTLVLRTSSSWEIDIAGIVLAFLERLREGGARPRRVASSSCSSPRCSS